MRIVFTIHALRKFADLKRLGWNLSRYRILGVLRSPRWNGVSRYNQKTAMDLIDETHIIRVIFIEEVDTIKIITFHIARRGKYESTL